MVKRLSMQKLLNELKDQVHTARFERIFQEKTEHLSGPQRLQLKMRLNELAKPAGATIDLRRKVPLPVKAFTHHGRTHYLDDTSEQLFIQGLRSNKGVFTEDTRQRIMQHVRELQANRDEGKVSNASSKAIGSFVLGRYYRRSEERMNFVIDVNVELPKKQLLKAVTVDISVQGLQLKLPNSIDADALVGKTLGIYFIGLAKEFVFDAERRYDYQLVGCHQKDGANYLRLRRMATADDDALDRLLQGLLSGYKFRYKVNVDHVIHSVRAKGHEDQWLQAQQGIPLVLSGDASKPVFAIATESNKQAISNWCQSQPLLLNALFNQRWVKQVLVDLHKQPEAQRQQLSFYFLTLTVQGEQRHYAIPMQALQQQPQLTEILVGLSRADIAIKSMVLSLTYSALDKLFVGLLSEMEHPNRVQVSSAKLKLDTLRAYQLKIQPEMGVTKVVTEHPRLTQLYTKCGLCNAMFVHQSSSQQQQIDLAALMPFKSALSGSSNNSDLWLKNSANLLGGHKMKQQLLQQLKVMKPAASEKSRTLLLHMSKDEQQQTKVNGLWLSDFSSFEDASRYIKKLSKVNRLLAVNVELYRCKRPQIRAFKDDLNYVKTYLPHRAKRLEQQLKSIDSVIGVQDVTQPVLNMALSS